VKNDGDENMEDMENMQTMNDNSMMDEDEINEECYEDWLAKELLAMDVDGGTCELIKRKTTFLNISSNAYYGGGTWFMDRWYIKPAEYAVRQKNNIYSVKDIVYSETQVQCVQTNTVCSFPTEQELEIIRGDMDSDNNIRKRKGRSPSSSNWSQRVLWRVEECQRRHLTGRRRLTKEQTIGTEIVLARQTRLDWKSNLAGEFGKVSGPVAALESGLNGGGDAQGDGLVHHQHHPAHPQLRRNMN
jgi:hypothetical protein